MTDPTFTPTVHGRSFAEIPAGEPVPASYLQEQIWLAEQLAPSLSVYGTPVVIGVRGALDLDLVARCMTAIVGRHESLRSRIVDASGSPVIYVDPPTPVDVVVLDLRTNPAAAEGRIGQYAREVFDLAQGVNIRVRLMRIAHDEHLLFLNIHHVAFDSWSLGVLWDEFVELYSAWSTGREPRLPELKAQYRDFAARQRDGISQEVMTAQLRFWAEQLSDAPVSLPWHGGGHRVDEPDYRGADVRASLPPSLRTAVIRCARQNRVTPFAVALAAWSVLLARFTRQDDLVIGTPLAGRTRSEFEPLIGLFVNVMPLRLRVDLARRFVDLLHEVSGTTLDALTSQDIPFPKVRDALWSGRGRMPVFGTAFSYEQSAQFDAAPPGCTVTSVHEVCTGASRFNLSVEAFDALGELSLRVEYNARLFDQRTIEQLVQSYAILLADVTEDVEKPVRLLRTGGTDNPQPGGQPAWPDEALALHHLFEAQAKRTPDAAAIEYENGDTATYRALNSQANRLARHLRSRGIPRGARVVVAIGRRSLWPVAILAILKAGCSYVPVDPAAPRERIEHILNQANAHAVLMEQNTASLAEASLLRVSVDSPEVVSGLKRYSSRNLGDEVLGGEIAFIPFTSGSTGLPKGTLVSHSNLVSFTLSAVSAYEISCEDRFLQLAALTFDVHVEELFPVWAVGGTVVLTGGEISRTTPADLLEIWHRRKITVCELPTAYWIEMVSTADWAAGPRPTDLRRVLVGGERAPTSHYERWQASGIPLTNVYGLTETSVTSVVYPVGPAPALEALPLGRPMAHAAVYVLDHSLAPVPPGFPGEIYVAGPGVGQGLLNMPGVTASLFQPDPFTGRPGARMYRTGDVGRLTPDGDLEFLGRRDDQVKIRSHRVEPAEVEAELELHPRVRQAVVRPVAAASGDTRLAAYVAADVDDMEIMRFARSRLPSHLVPARIMILDQLPLTRHGKVDRMALPAIASSPSKRPDETEITAVQQLVRSVYLEVLGIESIGVNDDIFDLGGHSLTALRIISRIRRKCSVRIPVTKFFNDSRIAAAAAYIEADAGFASNLEQNNKNIEGDRW